MKRKMSKATRKLMSERKKEWWAKKKLMDEEISEALPPIKFETLIGKAFNFVSSIPAKIIRAI